MSTYFQIGPSQFENEAKKTDPKLMEPVLVNRDKGVEF